jgi:hypothetical protein
MDPASAISAPNVLIGDSHITIRGVRLSFDELVDQRQLAADNALRLREEIRNAQPFEHLVLKDLFNDRMLQLIHDEFDLFRDQPWQRHSNKYEETRRSMPGSRLGPAASLYFWLVNSSPIAEFLSAVIGVPNLIPDPSLMGGGMHETRNGGHFAIHRDFDTHMRYGLHNAMVFITYLNKDWSPSYQGSLELWDQKRQACIKKVSPDFGSSLLMCHGLNSYHGYTTPLNMPEGRTRRSVATYYYTNTKGASQVPRTVSKFLFTSKADIAKGFVKQFIPPVVWTGLKKLKR